TKLTLTPSYYFGGKQGLFYLTGNSDIYLDNRFSVASEIGYYLGNINGNETFTHNHSLFFGGSYHCVKEQADFFLAFQPGVSYTQANGTVYNQENVKASVNPLISFNAGLNYYISNFFHFFISGRYIYGQQNNYPVVNLSEFRVSAGLGFNIHVLKKNNKKSCLE
ncbi:MAG: hypothetical protein D6707_03995, partial [Bacteroidetes bacterium]